MGIAHNRINMKGAKYGRLLVLEYHACKNKQATWLCQCDCGNQVIVGGAQLRNGQTKSCSCLRKERYNWAGYGEMGNQYWYIIKHHAKARGHKVTITLQYIWELFVQQNRRCALTGWPITVVSDYRNHKVEQTASLDRIDSKKGYEEDNVQWVHKDVNQLKWTFTEQYLFELCEAVIKHKGR